MEEWQNEIAAAFKDLTALFDGFGRELTELVEEVTAEAQEILNLQWDELKEVLTEIWQELELDFEESTPMNWDLPLQTQPMPDPSTHPACVGCINYNGSVYGGNLLVCGMYPYGCNSDTCADWAGENDLN
jgi:predicted phage tail protein